MAFTNCLRQNLAHRRCYRVQREKGVAAPMLEIRGEMLKGNRKAPQSFLKRVVNRGLRTMPFSSVHYPKASLL